MRTRFVPRIDSRAPIGPNAIIQTAAVLRDRLGDADAERLLYDATGRRFSGLPEEMVDEREVQALVRVVMASLGETQGTAVLREAGARTGDYLLANRIPKPVQWLMRLSPRAIGMSLLLRAMKSNAWTFAGSGDFATRQVGRCTELTFESCAMCRDMHAANPMCDFYAGTFERLISVLVARGAQVRETECMALGDALCRFAVDMPA
jgi:divinyl protochlorophyllide a 8-vinyl-reductase